MRLRGRLLAPTGAQASMRLVTLAHRREARLIGRVAQPFQENREAGVVGETARESGVASRRKHGGETRVSTARNLRFPSLPLLKLSIFPAKHVRHLANTATSNSARNRLPRSPREAILADSSILWRLPLRVHEIWCLRPMRRTRTFPANRNLRGTGFGTPHRPSR